MDRIRILRDCVAIRTADDGETYNFHVRSGEEIEATRSRLYLEEWGDPSDTLELSIALPGNIIITLAFPAHSVELAQEDENGHIVWQPCPISGPQFGDDHEKNFVFLGRFRSQEWNNHPYDLWWGPDCCGPTIVARWSPDGPDYSSGMTFGWFEDRPLSPLVEARKRAEARGLDVEREQWAGKMKRHGSGIYYVAGNEADAETLFGHLSKENQ